MERLYFDANATVPPHPDAVAAASRAMTESWANPTSTHREGQRARHAVEEARRSIAASLGVAPAELVVCASATEALHLLIRGLRAELGDEPAAVFPGEHSACLNPLRDWSRVS
ncbi:MAG TPA: aminotransferase class V-fold PLP-dependent enzyme, partial [Holophagaceae bacterium]|nr:aminotransferase class V-fold PLP-dependent enzyme [Holophagaceae bacterium]